LPGRFFFAGRLKAGAVTDSSRLFEYEPVRFVLRQNMPPVRFGHQRRLPPAAAQQQETPMKLFIASVLMVLSLSASGASAGLPQAALPGLAMMINSDGCVVLPTTDTRP
jgi:hypothetical protein